MSRYSPKNKEEALCYQLEDDVKVLLTLSQMDNKTSFQQHIKIMQSFLFNYQVECAREETYNEQNYRH